MAAKIEPYGVGIVRPFRRTPQGDIASGGGHVLLASNVGQVLGTVPGEIRWRPSFGLKVLNLRQRLNSAASQDLARVSTESALRRWEPRVQLTEVSVAPIEKGMENQMRLDVLWDAGGGREAGVRLEG